MNLTHRGPDFTGDLTIPISDGRELYLLGTLLQMRGRITPQPLTQAGKPRTHPSTCLSDDWLGDPHHASV